MYNHIKVTPNKNNVGSIIEAELSKFNNEIIEEVWFDNYSAYKKINNFKLEFGFKK